MQTEQLSVRNEGEWLTAYLDGELSADETETFEVYALSRPNLLQRIDADTNLRIAVRMADWPNQNVSGFAGSERSGQQTVGMRGRDRPSRPRFAMAACFIAGALGMWAASTVLRGHRGGLESLQFTRVVFDVYRGPSAEVVTTGPGNTEWVLLDFRLAEGATDARVSIDRSAPLVLNLADGFASLLMRRTQFANAQEAVIEYTVDGQRRKQVVSLTKGSMSKT